MFLHSCPRAFSDSHCVAHNLRKRAIARPRVIQLSGWDCNELEGESGFSDLGNWAILPRMAAAEPQAVPTVLS